MSKIKVAGTNGISSVDRMQDKARLALSCVILSRTSYSGTPYDYNMVFAGVADMVFICLFTWDPRDDRRTKWRGACIK